MDQERIYFVKEDSRAVVPARSYETDAGYDLTVIKVHKDYGNGVVLYDTGVSIRPHNEGVYFDLVARSSLPKRGYMLANSIGIIDNGYRGNLMVQLYKFDPNAEDLELPARVAQLIPRKMQPVVFQVDQKRYAKKRRTTQKDKNVRGTGGFGSTEKEKEKEIEK